MQVFIQAVLIFLLSVGSALFLNAEYKKIRRFRDYRDLRPYIIPSAIAFGGFTLLILVYLGSPSLEQDTLIVLLGGYLALAVSIPMLGTFTAIISHFRSREIGETALRAQDDKPGTKFLENAVNISIAAITIMIVWTVLERGTFLTKPWYQPFPIQTALDKVCVGLLVVYAVLEIFFISKCFFARYPGLVDDPE
jgi:hypothetical protein